MNQFNFDHLKPTSEKEAVYTLHQLKGHPTLRVRMALEGNTRYYNAVLKRSRHRIRQLRTGMLDVEMMEESREEDRELYPLHIVVGWDGVVSTAGKIVPFSQEACKELLRELPNWVFDDLRQFCGEIGNFLEETDGLKPEAIEDRAKN